MVHPDPTGNGFRPDDDEGATAIALCLRIEKKEQHHWVTEFMAWNYYEARLMYDQTISADPTSRYRLAAYGHNGIGATLKAVYADTQVAEIKARQHYPPMQDWAVGFDLYVEGFDIEHCINDEERTGWRQAKAGELDTVSAEMERAE